MTRHLVGAHTDLAGSVEVVVEWQTPLDGRADAALRELVGKQRVLYAQRAFFAVKWCCESAIALGLDEVGQYRIVIPAATAFFAPAVEVGTVTANVDHGVDRRRTAQCLSPGVQVRSGVMRLGFEAVIPIDFRTEQSNPQRRHPNGVQGVGRAGLE